MYSAQFTSETSSNGVVERGFMVGEVPGVLWSPAVGSGHVPLVLLAHGGGQHKKAPGIVGRAHRFVTGCGFAVAAIDAPGHGARTRTAADERHIEFLLQWDDEHIERRSGLALFDAFASKEKTLHANAGGLARCPGSRSTARPGSSPGTSAGPARCRTGAMPA
jgi:hypothetical protein